MLPHTITQSLTDRWLAKQMIVAFRFNSIQKYSNAAYATKNQAKTRIRSGI